ncbi:uncharacterized protein LOC120113695 [Hibiscus syriacus]|uniref:uncharacterized protein LOC120113695 n=1 Tax=Hibiscus syriacus TaxID=106335 RepID=UPI001921EC79|nr:uncharacterized protein LOC120113695 [Hibiscus syriacus]
MIAGFWEAEVRAHFSWILKKFLKLREVARCMFLPSVDWNLVRDKWIWDKVRICRDKVRWHKIIWFPAHIPKFSLISWMAILDRLSTKDRLIRFGLTMDADCVVCGTGLESRDHLFADCPFSREVWNAVLSSCGFRSVMLNWDDRLNWLIDNLRGNSLRVRILKLAWTAFLYYIWEERNYRSFRGLSRSVDCIVNRIRESVKIKLYSHCMHRIDDVNRSLCIS